MIINLTTGQESTDGLGWDTSKPYSDQTPEVKAQASQKASENSANADVTLETGGGNSRPQALTFVDGIALYTVTPDFYFDVALKSFMLTSKININVTQNNI